MAYFHVYVSATLAYLASTFRFNVDVIQALGDIMDGKDTKIYGDLAEVSEMINNTEDMKASQYPLLGQLRALLNKIGSLRDILDENVFPSARKEASLASLASLGSENASSENASSEKASSENASSGPLILNRSVQNASSSGPLKCHDNPNTLPKWLLQLLHHDVPSAVLAWYKENSQNCSDDDPASLKGCQHLSRGFRVHITPDNARGKSLILSKCQKPLLNESFAYHDEYDLSNVVVRGLEKRRRKITNVCASTDTDFLLNIVLRNPEKVDAKFDLDTHKIVLPPVDGKQMCLMGSIPSPRHFRDSMIAYGRISLKFDYPRNPIECLQFNNVLPPLNALQTEWHFETNDSNGSQTLWLWGSHEGYDGFYLRTLGGLMFDLGVYHLHEDYDMKGTFSIRRREFEGLPVTSQFCL